MGDTLKQPVVVENKAGAGMTLGALEVMRAQPDGHTLLFSTSSIITGAMLTTRRPYDVQKDFTPVSLVASSPLILVASPQLQVKDLQGLLAHARGRSQPLSYASSGNGTIGHLAAELFRSMTGLQGQHIPYRGLAPAIPDLMSGQVHWAFDGPGSAFPHVNGKRLTGIAVSSQGRLKSLPDVPTFAEQGMPAYNARFWFGLFGPAGMPSDLVARLVGETRKALASQSVASAIEVQGLEAMGTDSATLRLAVRDDIQRWGKVIADAKVVAG
jgi:tripartite-type tricarboxylate transporter receptor subunit TctC